MWFDIFDGTNGQWSVFMKNQQHFFKFFQDQPEQQLHQLSLICSPSIAKTILSFSTPTKALEWLHLKGGQPHLQIPAVYDEIRNMTPAKNQSEAKKP